ncbi:hypothetical protein C5167_025656 [Papaver somniferum]|uniref:Apple domain-containing protein n=1 Tax=Papaver somniferum TaxID=3469 RepID=A0A4Y7JRY6_PAPSO|nr:hypothetical protein C5167_025656 [Papaver somniferum]
MEKSRRSSSRNFHTRIKPGTRQTFIRWNKSVQVWTTGEWSEINESYPLIPMNMTGNYIVNESFISNVNESYLTYTLFNSSILNRIVMDVSGQLKQYTWTNMMKKANLFLSVPEQICDVYGVCGPFGNCNQDTMKCDCLPGFIQRSPSDWNLQDSTGGCVRNFLQCGKKDGFSPMSTSNLPDNPYSPQVSSAEECKDACESTCTCNAYAYRDLSVSCGMEICWMSNNSQMVEQESLSQTFSFRNPQFRSSQKEKDRNLEGHCTCFHFGGNSDGRVRIHLSVQEE